MARDAPELAALLTIDDWEAAAAMRLSQSAYDYYRSGADGEITLDRNRDAYARWEIWYRVLRDVSHVDTRTTILGVDVSTPILVAPTAYHKLACPDGECASARAAAAAGTIFTLSTLATTRLEDVALASAGPKWFQLYVHKDRGLTRSLVERARAAGYRALVLTVDTPILGRRLRDVRNRFALPDGLTMENLVDFANVAGVQGSALASYVASFHDASLGFENLAWLAELAGPTMPLVVKGIVRPDDAVRALAHGAAAILVSNHGARQLDSAPATLDALVQVVEAVAGRAPVLVDGGIRWGTDVFKALALGAAAVLVGRPLLWGLAVDGEDGARAVLDQLARELSNAMALAGSASLADIDRTLVARFAW